MGYQSPNRSKIPVLFTITLPQGAPIRLQALPEV
jgi:hypothetical protein